MSLEAALEALTAAVKANTEAVLADIATREKGIDYVKSTAARLEAAEKPSAKKAEKPAPAEEPKPAAAAEKAATALDTEEAELLAHKKVLDDFIGGATGPADRKARLAKAKEYFTKPSIGAKKPSEIPPVMWPKFSAKIAEIAESWTPVPEPDAAEAADDW